MTSVLIADDHAVVRAGLRQFLEEDRSVREIGEAATGTETLNQLRAKPWDLLILDIYMPDRGGLDILAQARSRHAETKVLVMSALPERQYALHAIKGGASGYLAKDSAPEELLKAMRTVLQGRRYISPTLADLLVTELDQNSDQPVHSRLSEREFQIFCKLAAGRTATEIGKELFLSVKTVSTYRSRLLEKMNMSTNADLTSYALRNGIIQ
ncbi:MAG: response regulator transcription factor [Bryobacteraceae bacterium]